MLTRWRRVGLSCAVGVGAAVLTIGPAMAGDSTGFMNCSENPRPQCSVGAGSSTTTHRRSAHGADSESGEDSASCHGKDGKAIPCRRDGAWAGSDGCYYKPTRPSAATVKALGGQPDGTGGWYLRTCYGEAGRGEESFGTPVWRPRRRRYRRRWWRIGQCRS